MSLCFSCGRCLLGKREKVLCCRVDIHLDILHMSWFMELLFIICLVFILWDLFGWNMKGNLQEFHIPLICSCLQQKVTLPEVTKTFKHPSGGKT